MGLCLCGHIFDDDDELSYTQSFARDCAVLRSKIQARKMPIIWILGDEKAITSHAANVAERFGFSCLDANKISRDETLKDSNRGKIIKAKMAQGKKVPDRVMVDLVKEKMLSAGDTRGYIFSGFPTTIKQALLFTREMSPVDCVILLQYGKTTSSPEKEMHSIPPISPLSFSFSAPTSPPQKMMPVDKERPISQSQPATPQTSTYQHEIHQIQHSLQHLPQMDQFSTSSPSPGIVGVTMLKGDRNKRQKNISEKKRLRQKEKLSEREVDKEAGMEGEKKDVEKENEKQEEEIKEFIECTGAKWDLVLEKINASEAASDIFLKIEAAIMDRTQTSE